MAYKRNFNYDFTIKFTFISSWYDYGSQYTKNLILSFFPYDNSVELFDKDCNRIFLRRSASESIDADKFYIGSIVLIYGRHINIVDYGDEFTKKIVSKLKEHTFILVKPSIIDKLGEVINELYASKFSIHQMRMAKLSRAEALQFYESKKGDIYLPFQIEHIISGKVVGMEVVGDDAINRLLEMAGPDDPEEAKLTHPTSLKARYGDSKAANAFHVATDAEAVKKAVNFFFPKDSNILPLAPTFQLQNSTCCVVKPHVIEERNLGNLIVSIQEHPYFKITALKMLYFTVTDCEEFLEVYKGIIPDFHNLVLSYLDGPAVVLEVTGKVEGVEIFHQFKKFCGPMYSDFARQIRPQSLRAMYGRDEYKNAVHCSDLRRDTILELEYVFRILDCNV